MVGHDGKVLIDHPLGVNPRQRNIFSADFARLWIILAYSKSLSDFL